MQKATSEQKEKKNGRKMELGMHCESSLRMPDAIKCLFGPAEKDLHQHFPTLKATTACIHIFLFSKPYIILD